MKGLFITFEGIEGSGKTTQVRMLDEYLRGRGFQTVTTREPGGTEIGDQIRKILLSPDNTPMDPIAELMLYEAGRTQHILEVIAPALGVGKIVLCDRYFDATTAYQGAARMLPRDMIETLNRIAAGDAVPELTILVDLPVDEGLTRAHKRNRELNLTGNEDRFENEKLAFHERVRQGYLDIASAEPHRVKIVDGTKSIEGMHADMVLLVEKALGKRMGEPSSDTRSVSHEVRK